MAKRTPSNPLPAEQQAELLRAKEKPLGKTGETSEEAPIAWDHGLAGQPGTAAEARGPAGGGAAHEVVSGTATTAGSSVAGEAIPRAPAGSRSGAVADSGMSGGAAAMAFSDAAGADVRGGGGGTAIGVDAAIGRAGIPAAGTAGSAVGSGGVGSPAHSSTGGASGIGGSAGVGKTPAMVSGDDAGTVAEGVGTRDVSTVTGRLMVFDPDVGESHFKADKALVGQFGHLAIAADGHWTYTLDNSNPAVQALGEGVKAQDILTITTADGTTSRIVITITGTQDAPMIGGVHTGDVTEDTLAKISGALTITDVDAGQDRFQPGDQTGTYGTLHLAADGQWTYDLANTQGNVQKVGAGETATDIFTVTSADGTTHQISVTLYGTNDVPQISGTTSAAIREDSVHHTVGGKLDAVDADATAQLNWAVDHVDGQYGGLAFNTGTGAWAYTMDVPRAQTLAQGQLATERYTATLTDEHGASSQVMISVTLEGTNSDPVIKATITTPVTEDGPVLKGKAIVHDVDQGDAHTFSTTNPPAGFTLNADGSYSFDPCDAAYQSLSAGQTQTLTIPIVVADTHGASATQTLMITVTGTNDGATVTGTSTAQLTEDTNLGASGKLEASGDLVVTDVDVGQDHFTDQINAAGSGGYGSFNIDASGHWSYSADNSQTAVQQLKAGETLTDTLVVTTAEGTQYTLTVTLNGTNDVPVLQAQSQRVTEDDAVLTGQMVATDVDKGDMQTFSTTNPPAGFTLNADGSYSFDASNPAYQHLAAGQSIVIDIPVTVTDSASSVDTQVLQVTVAGTNDAPVVFGPVNLGQMQEDGSLILTAPLLLAKAGDIDTGDTLTLSQLAADHGQVVDNGDGTYTFRPDANYNGPVSLSYQVTDSQGASVSAIAGLSVSAVGDIAVIGGTDAANLTEDRNVNQARHLTAAGQLTVNDPDAGEDHFTAQTNVQSQYGSFNIDASGRWTYSASNTQAAVQQLKSGEQLTDSLTVTSADGTQQTLTVTINGTNDAPVLQAQTQRVPEDGARLNGQMVATDADAAETRTFSTTNPAAGFTLNADGSYSFDPADIAYQHLGLGQQQVISIPVTVTDSTGLASTKNLVITITGTNDAPQLAPTPVKILEGATPIQGQLTATDPDTGDTLTYSSKAPVPGFVLNPDGSFSFDPAHAAYNTLGAGQERIVSIPVTVVDGHGGATTQNLEITVTGTNDGPALTATAQTVNEGDALLRGQLTGTDADSGDTLTYSTTAQPDGFTLNADGSYTFDPAHAAFDTIGLGQTRVLTIPVMVSDGQGGTATQNLQITIRGTNDAPVMVAEPAKAATEGGAILHGQLAATDPDTADTLTYKASSAVPGFLLNPDGTYSFNPNNGTYNHLAAGQSQVISIPVTVTDGHGGTDSQTLQITITGTDDGPAFVIVGTLSATEGGAVLTGQLTATDPDTGDTLTYGTSAQVAGFVLNADGSYTFDPSDTAYDSLGVGHSKTVSVPITVTDSQGQSVTQTLQITIAGTNDSPTLSAVAPSTVAEDSSVMQGRLTIADVDKGDSLTCSTSAAVAGFNLNPDGSYTFDPSNHAYDHLAPGDSQVLSIPVSVSDGHGGSASHTLQITITGSNDGPALTVADQTVSEGAAVLHGQFVGNDPDAGDTLTYSTSATVAGFALNADGTYTFDAANAAFNSLGVGHNQVVSIPVTVTDSHGATATRSLQITVEGTDDAPVLTATPRNVNEGDATIQGRLAAVDPDVGDALTYSTTATVAGFRLTPDGSYTFDPSNAAYNSLAAGTSQDVSIPVTVTDGHGGTTTQNLIITIAGVNDAARISGASTGTVTEDSTVTATGKIEASGKLTVTDVDTGEAVFTAQTNVAGTNHYGSFSIDAAGHWTYCADNGQSDIQQLQAGQTLTDTLTVASADGTQQTITVTINGTNDAPTVTGTASMPADLGAVTEDTAHTYTQADLIKLVGGADADTGDTLSISAVTVDAQYGAFSKLANGDWKFTPAANAHHDDIPLTISVSDGHATTQANGVLDITPVTDAPTPVLSVLAEQQVIAFDGSANGAVMNHGDLNAGGTITQLAVEFTIIGGPQVTTTAGHGATFISYAAKGGSENEFYVWNPDNLTVRIHGQEYQTGINTGVDQDSHRYSVLWNSTTGSLDVLVDGQVAKHMDNIATGYQIPGTGKLVLAQDQDSYGGGFAAQDAFHGQMFSASMANAHVDPAQLAQASLRDVLHGSPNLLIDIQAEGGHVVDTTGHYTMDAGSGITFPTVMVDTAIASPNPGALLHLTPNFGTPADTDDHVNQSLIKGFVAGTVLDDGHGHSHTVTGPDDKVDIHDWNTASLTAQLPAGSHDNLRLEMQVTTTGPDGAAAVASTDMTVVIDPTQAVPGVTAFDPGVVDPAAINVQISLTGNDPALIGGDVTGITPDDDTAVSGVLTITDSAAAEAHFVAQTDVAGTYGKFSVAADGHWTYTPDDRADAIEVGHTASEKFVVTSADGTAQNVAITITGSPDAAVITGTDSGSVIEDDATHTASGTLTATGGSQAGFKAETLAGNFGSLSMAADGSWTYTLDNSKPEVQQLGASGTATETLKVSAADGTQHDITLSIHGSNDGPVMGLATASTGPAVSGQAMEESTDDVLMQFLKNIQGPLDGDGAVAQVLLAKLGEPLSEQDRLDYASGKFDQTIQELEGMYLVAEGNIKLVGPVGGGRVFGGQDFSATFGDLIAWRMQGPDYQVHMIRVVGQGGSDMQMTTANGDTSMGFTLPDGNAGIVGNMQSNCVPNGFQPEVTGPAPEVTSGELSEDNVQTATGTLHAHDVDTGDTLSWSVAGGGHGAHGTFAIDATTGQWTYTLDNSGTAVQGLDAGAKVTDTFTVEVTDGSTVTTQTMTMTIAGSEDTAVITGDLSGAVTEDNATKATASGQVQVVDPDTGDSLDMTAQTYTGLYGTLTMAADGQWQYTLDNSNAKVQALTGVEPTPLVENIVVNSAGGVSNNLHINITGSADGVTVTASALHPADLGDVNEDTSVTFSEADLLSKLGAVAENAGDTLSISAIAVDPHYGAISKELNGDWKFTPTANVNADHVPFSITVSDGHVTTTGHAEIDIKQVTDAPTVSLSVAAQQEVITTGPSAGLGRIQIDHVQTAPLSELTLEFTVIGNPNAPAASGGVGPVIVNIGSTSAGNNNVLSLWNPYNMKIGGAGDLATGINLNDGQSHRITLTWDSTSGNLKVFDNGALKATATNFHTGSALPDNLYTVVGGKINALATKDGFLASEHYEGQIFNTALSSHALSDVQVQTAPLASQTSAGTGLVFDVRSVGGQLVDATGHHTLATQGGLGHTTLAVDTSIGVPPPGALLHIDVSAQPTAADDTVTALQITGFTQGTVISDGTHTHTVTGPSDPVDVHGWSLSSLTAQLPAGSNANMHLAVIATTTGPDGSHATTTEAQPLVLDPTHIVPADPTTHAATLAMPVAGSNDGSALATFTHVEAATVTVKEDVGVHDETAATVRNHLAGTYFAHEINSVSTFDKVHQGFQQIEISDSDSATDNAHFAGADGKTYAYQAGGPMLRIPAEHGSFEVFGSGGNVFWKFHANNDNPDVQALNEGDQIQDQIFVVSKDGTHLPLTAIIQGTDEAAAPAPVPTGDALAIDAADGTAAASPLDDYLQFAVQSDGHGGPSLSIASPFASASDDAALYIQAPDHDGSIPLDIAASSSEAGDVVAVRILGLPEGTQLSAGHLSPNGIWVLAPDELPGLSLTPPAGFSGEMDLTVKAVSHGLDASVERTAIHDVVIDVPADGTDAPAPPAPTPLDDYLQFAAPVPEVGAGGTAYDADSSPLNDYLAAGGVDPAHVSADAPDLPPTEVLIDAIHATDAPTTPDENAVDDAALTAIPPDLLDTQPQDDPQHHGV